MRAEYDFSIAKKNPYAVKPDRQVPNTFVDSAKVMAKGQTTIPNLSPADKRMIKGSGMACAMEELSFMLAIYDDADENLKPV